MIKEDVLRLKKIIRAEKKQSSSLSTITESLQKINVTIASILEANSIDMIDAKFTKLQRDFRIVSNEYHKHKNKIHRLTVEKRQTIDMLYKKYSYKEVDEIIKKL